jgi:hypothetical protein
MKSVIAALCAAAVCAAAGFAAAPAVAQSPAPATSQSKMKVCAEEWNAKKAANETANLKYRDFVKECMTHAGATPAAPEGSSSGETTAAPAVQPPAARPPGGSRAATQTKPATPSAGEPVFPTEVSPKYSSESAGRARMHTCLDQYRDNKTTNGNAGLNWIQRGGGYYSECNKRLKG